MSSTTPPVDPRAPLPPAVVILGNDAQLAARPATPVQLAHACLAAGFRAAIPASWGDELVAAATLGVIESRSVRPVIHCACPHVARRMLAVGTELAANLVSLVAPPVAAAKYLRSHATEGIRVTYVGRCPAASDDSIDARLTPEELLAQLAERGIDLLDQPEVFESVIPPDRRRHYSLPGGLPAPEQLWNRTGLRVETLSGDDFTTDVAERVLSRADVLIDAALATGCVCSGAIRGAPAADARTIVASLEPPRSPTAVIEERGTPPMEVPIPIVARTVSDLAIESPSRGLPASRVERELPPVLAILQPPTGATEAHPRRPRLTPPGSPVVAGPPQAASAASPPPPRRRSPAGSVRVVPPSSIPVATDQEGRILPRAYGARRRSPRGGVPLVPDQAAIDRPAVAVPSLQENESGPDAERLIERSVEPVVPAAPAVPVAPASLATPAPVPGASRPMSPVTAYFPVNRRLTVAAAVVAAVLVVGVAIGYAAGRRGDTSASDLSGGHPGLQIDSSAASAAPDLGTRRPVVRSPAQSAPRGAATTGATSRRIASGARRSARPDSPAPATQSATTLEPAPAAGSSPAVFAPSSTPPPSAATDSAARRVRRDSAAAPARADSLAAEREAIRREIERRRIRVDSLVRAQQGNPPDAP